jgi:hypothetical protein
MNANETYGLFRFWQADAAETRIRKRDKHIDREKD